MITCVRLWLGFALAAFAAGCATPSGGWSTVDDASHGVEVGRLSMELPNGWMRLKQQDAGHVLVSRDGMNLQMIEVVYAKSEDAFPKLKRGAPAGALASELAELQLAEMRASPGTENLEVLQNEPANVADYNGFMLHVRFKNTRGLRYERIVFGFSGVDGYYTVTYQAPTLYYFSRDRSQFDALVHSLHAAGKTMSS
jgi:hypothetical protein